MYPDQVNMMYSNQHHRLHLYELAREYADIQNWSILRFHYKPPLKAHKFNLHIASRFQVGHLSCHQMHMRYQSHLGIQKSCLHIGFKWFCMCLNLLYKVWLACICLDVL